MISRQLNDEVRRSLDLLGDEVPLPARGATRVRLAAMVELGRADLSLARMAEPHLDAVAILAEAGCRPRAAALYGVWASEAARPLELRMRDGRPTLAGQKSFCGGAAICDSALVSAVTADGREQRLVEVDLARGREEGSITVDGESWRSPAFEATTTSTVSFRDHVISTSDLVGGPDFYLARPGFWHGALAPAAVWAGGALGLLELVSDRRLCSPHQRADLGGMRALIWAMRAQLDVAADEADADPTGIEAARRRALTVRHLIERQCTQVLDRFFQAYGPRPLVFDDHVIRRVQELQIYIRQVHGGADLEELGTDPQAEDLT